MSTQATIVSVGVNNHTAANDVWQLGHLVHHAKAGHTPCICVNVAQVAHMAVLVPRIAVHVASWVVVVTGFVAASAQVGTFSVDVKAVLARRQPTDPATDEEVIF